MALVDKDGLTEREFLAAYREKDYPKPSLTVDIAIFRPADEGVFQLLLIKRGGHPFLGCWALPGGFVEKGEDADTAAARELAEETGVTDLELSQLGLYSTPGRDPRCWTVSEAYLAAVPADAKASAGDDAAEAAWFDVTVADRADGAKVLTARHGADELNAVFEQADPPFGAPRASLLGADGFAFDHGRIVADAWLLLNA